MNRWGGGKRTKQLWNEEHRVGKLMKGRKGGEEKENEEAEGGER